MVDIRIGFPADAYVYAALGVTALYDLDRRVIYLDFEGLREDDTITTVEFSGGECRRVQYRFHDWLLYCLEHEMLHDVLNRLFGPDVCLALDNVAEGSTTEMEAE